MTEPWYPFYVGDYARKTAHLSLLEHGAYRLLIDHYMATRHPLPADPGKLYRICRARTPAERRAVDSVVAEFFTEIASLMEADSVARTEPLLRHEKCDSELAKQLNYKEAQSARAKRRHSPGSAPALQRAPVPQPQPHSEVSNDDAVEAVSPNAESALERSMRTHPEFDAARKLFVARWPHLGRQNASVINDWLCGGASIDEDILPTIEHVAMTKGGDVGSFRYFENQVMSAVNARKQMDEIFDNIARKNG